MFWRCFLSQNKYGLAGIVTLNPKTREMPRKPQRAENGGSHQSFLRLLSIEMGR
jgi:hypothetical protein